MANGRYSQIIKTIFEDLYETGSERMSFERTMIETAAERLGISAPKNYGDLIYSFRSRNPLPVEISSTAPEGFEWLIESEGSAKYAFALRRIIDLTPSPSITPILIPEGTPSLVDHYALSDEQALLTKIRYNRIIDLFINGTCYHLQSHLRTQVSGIGQIETDDVYVGFDSDGKFCVLPIQAKSPKDQLSRIQIEHDFALCESKFPDLESRPIAAQFMSQNTIALLEFEMKESELSIVNEAHYQMIHVRDALDDSD